MHGRTRLGELAGLVEPTLGAVRTKLRGWATAARSNFAFAIASLPPERREGVVALYRYARIADDIADDDGIAADERVRALEGLRRDLDAIYAGGTPAHPGLEPLARTVRRYGVPRPPLDALIDGCADDLRILRYPAFDALRRYCQRVASAVGLACLPVFGCREPDTAEYADALGLALQLTNIIRDVGEDAGRGRIYLPADEREAFGVTDEELLAGRRGPGFDALMRFQAARARDYDRTAQRLLARMPGREQQALRAAEVMRETYASLLDRIERGGFDVLTPAGATHRTIALPLWQRAAIAGRTLWRLQSAARS